jgi:starch-binding outer membrane protein, SusD/RagB family
LRHNSAVGNWGKMTSLKYNDKTSTYFGQNVLLRHPSTNAWLCTDTIRCWFDWPHYKIYLDDVTAEANPASNQFNGATTGGNGDWYFYRLAETYLLRAEAKFYLGDATAVDDVNEVRKRALCTQLYSTVTIGDIMNERARELYLEEWRNVELSRVSYCLALSGKPDEWGNVYDVNTFDKQTGTDAAGGSYWYQRIIHYSIYNKGPVSVRTGTFNYTMDKRNFYWPIPNAAITANNKGVLSQNFGYSGYDPETAKWETWEEAVADETKVSN